MTSRHKTSQTETMLELWRPSRGGAGEPMGCLATTYTFDPGLFDEECLARFLEVEADPDREDLAFLLERERRLGAAYAGVMVDHTQAGVSHSLRWDVLPVRIPRGKQHAKLTLLAWTGHVRVIVTSANLTEAGYRFNREVAQALGNTPQRAETRQVEAAVAFLRCLLGFVSGAGADMPEIRRVLGFLERVERLVSEWTPIRPSKDLRQHLVFTLPQRNSNPATGETGFEARSSLEEAVSQCRKFGGSPSSALIASPFFDAESDGNAAAAALCKAMARGVTRRLNFCIPALGDPHQEPLRLAAPASLRTAPKRYGAVADFGLLPQRDDEGHFRSWHAKMLAFHADAYSALMIGSSNFTCAGLGIGPQRNSEANVLLIAERRPYSRRPGELESVWPQMVQLKDPASAEWQGPKPDLEEEQRMDVPALPPGFLAAVYRAGENRQILLRLDPERLPAAWQVRACGAEEGMLLDSEGWASEGASHAVFLPWQPVYPPEKLLVQWSEGEAFWALNVEDAQQLPPPVELGEMSADDMLLVLAASDPSAAFRAWVKEVKKAGNSEDELDSAVPVDLDPLRRHDLRATFLRRIRSRARGARAVAKEPSASCLEPPGASMAAGGVYWD